MDQIKTGKFIAKLRKELGLTQNQLAVKLYVTDRAVSKWENGRSMPDSSIMLNLCNFLHISVNDLLSGEIINMDNYNDALQTNLLDAIKEKQLADKRLLRLEYVLGFVCSIVFIGLIFLASFIELPDYLRIILIASGFVLFAIGVSFCIRIEQQAGYYKCPKCGHIYIPRYMSVLFSLHYSRTRYMKCPNCKKHTWQKKVIEKE